MSEWKEFRLGEVAEITSSKRVYYSDYVESGIPFWRSKEVIERYNGKEITTELFISEEHYEDIKSKFGVPQQNDILLTSVGSLGIPYMVKIDDRFYFKDGNLVWIRNIDASKLYPQYLFKWLGSDLAKNALGEITIGSTQEALTIVGLKSLMLVLPSLPEQKAIASVLSSLDDKIDLLHRQNTTLEKMAEAIFRQWFIEEAKDEWNQVTLNDYVSCYNGVSYKSIELNPSNTAMITLKNFSRNGGFRFDGFKEYTGKYKDHHIVKQGDLVVAHTDITQDAAIIGNPILIYCRSDMKKYVYSMDLVKVMPKYIWLSREYLYYLMKTIAFKNHCVGLANGSTVLHLDKDAIPSYGFKIPPENKIRSFTKIVNSLLMKISKNNNSIQHFEKLRDTLLPKLMSGEVRVKL